MSDNPSSLRDLYTNPPPDWTFVPPSVGGNSFSSPGASHTTNHTPSYTFYDRPPQNSIFELSPGLAEPGGMDVRLLLRAAIASALLQYTSTAIAMPWEVAKCLLQVQWVPRDAGETIGEEAVQEEEAVEEEVSLSPVPASPRVLELNDG